jgi:membrane protein DedA with SNARE-associated domain
LSALIPGEPALVAFGLLAACSAMPIFLFVLVMTGYFDDYGS